MLSFFCIDRSTKTLYVLIFRKNCKGNPLCLSGLGEKKWFTEIADSAWHSIEDPNGERRKKVKLL